MLYRNKHLISVGELKKKDGSRGERKSRGENFLKMYNVSTCSPLVWLKFPVKKKNDSFFILPNKTGVVCVCVCAWVNFLYHKFSCPGRLVYETTILGVFHSLPYHEKKSKSEWKCMRRVVICNWLCEDGDDDGGEWERSVCWAKAVRSLCSIAILKSDWGRRGLVNDKTAMIMIIIITIQTSVLCLSADGRRYGRKEGS